VGPSVDVPTVRPDAVLVVRAASNPSPFGTIAGVNEGDRVDPPIARTSVLIVELGKINELVACKDIKAISDRLPNSCRQTAFAISIIPFRLRQSDPVDNG